MTCKNVGLVKIMKFEYKLLRLSIGVFKDKTASVEEQMNELGLDGWDLVRSELIGDGVEMVCIFKRQVLRKDP